MTGPHHSEPVALSPETLRRWTTRAFVTGLLLGGVAASVALFP